MVVYRGRIDFGHAAYLFMGGVAISLLSKKHACNTKDSLSGFFPVFPVFHYKLRVFICLSQIYQSANSSEYINYMFEIFVFNFKLKVRAGKYFTLGETRR
jgi:hypothetical protein